MNDILKLIPEMKAGDALISALSVLPDYNENVRYQNEAVRLIALSDIYRIYIPSPMTTEIYSKLYLALLRSLQKKMTKTAVIQQNQNYRAIQQQEYSGIMGGSDSFTIIGNSGIGKSSAISRSLSLLQADGIIETQKPYAKIIPCVVVQCPFDSSVKGLLDGKYRLTDYYIPDKTSIRNRLSVYEGNLNTNISQKENMLSATWCRSDYNKAERVKIKNNFYNFRRNIMKASGEQTMWTCYKDCRKELTGKGYANSFVPCNCRATNEYQDKTCLMYGVNWYENPEIVKFFAQHGITINQDTIALSTILQWVWRSNIRVTDSTEKVTIYIPAKRMRNIFTQWLNG